MSKRTYVLAVSAIMVAIILGGNMLAGGGARKPAKTDFGPGPKMSQQGLYLATLHGAETLKPRKLQQLKFSVIDAKGQAVSNATITVDGGMPEHGHGLPTQPKVTGELGSGWYEISGLRFNMGGWWELKLTITTPAGTDTVVFNLSL
jgi:hypothetical protein